MDFCDKYEIPERIRNILLRWAELTTKWKVWTSTTTGRKSTIIEVPLQAKSIRATVPVEEYPRFIDVVQGIVTGERPVGQIGPTYQGVLAGALLFELDRPPGDEDA
jgi:hypothetical protein